MVKPVQRVGDNNNKGGTITQTPQSLAFDEGKLVAVNGSTGTTHPPGNGPHVTGVWKTAGGSTISTLNGKGVNRTGDTDTCGDKRVGGSGLWFTD